MIVDAECGMPLDLGRWESLWEEGGDDSGLCLNSSFKFVHCGILIVFLQL